MERQDFYRTFSGILRTIRAPREFPDPAPDDNLWDLGHLDSFAMVELLIHLEELTGQEITLTADSLRNFHTMERIYDSYFAKEAA
ncbi:phosphopantetheine-binding protein [Streptomyces adelaidensis]|uniref:phosphopantetheine-binding protein n=1 Tax=Streptomyces adelaidensis TaxID=2796465 RepID=UPI00190454F4|nr:phosphopantetheine-binding protein [Streptomyces adelaidensis]